MYPSGMYVRACAQRCETPKQHNTQAIEARCGSGRSSSSSAKYEGAIQFQNSVEVDREGGDKHGSITDCF